MQSTKDVLEVSCVFFQTSVTFKYKSSVQHKMLFPFTFMKEADNK